VQTTEVPVSLKSRLKLTFMLVSPWKQEASWKPLRLLDGIDHTLLFEENDGSLELLIG